MNTILQQQVWGISASRAARRAVREIKRLEKLWNRFAPDSFISKLNRAAGIRPLKADRDTLSILKISKSISELTDFTFDITVLPILQCWKNAEKQGKIPETEELKGAISLVDSFRIQINNDNTVYLSLKGQAIDLGAIAKGYAVDLVREIYLEYCIKHAVINFGGNVLVIGNKPNGSPWKVGLQKPGKLRGECFGFVEISDCSVATSGNYERYYRVCSDNYSHIINPKTGQPIVNDLSSVSVITQSSCEADAFATAMMVMGEMKTRELLNKIDNYQVITLNADNRVNIFGKTISNFILI